MSAVNMSLDQIIAGNKKQRTGRPGGKLRSDGIQKERGGARTAGARNFKNFSFTDKVPEGKWAHDKFAETEGAPRRTGGGGGGNPNRKVTVNVSNLAADVTSADLEELFDKYELDSGTVHFNEFGESLGSGSVVLKRAEALRLLEENKNVCMDGKPLKMVILDDGTSNRPSIKSRLQFVKPSSGRIQKSTRSGFEKKKKDKAPRKAFLDRIEDSDEEPTAGRTSGARRGGRAGRSGNPRKQMTAEELDAELEAYMKKM